jgi:aryl-alcohol dehydrogenase-like predicted oxidoreductase
VANFIVCQPISAAFVAASAGLLAKPAIPAPIASATSVKQLYELLGATQLKLDSAAVQKLDQASAYSEEERKIA